MIQRLNGRPLWGRHGREAPTVVATGDMGTRWWQTGSRELWPELETVNSAQNSLPKAGPQGPALAMCPKG